jgi:hypothetical protein
MDYFDAYDGNTLDSMSASTLVTKACGSTMPNSGNSIVSTGNVMAARFHSDKTVGASGFLATVTFIDGIFIWLQFSW